MKARKGFALSEVVILILILGLLVAVIFQGWQIQTMKTEESGSVAECIAIGSDTDNILETSYVAGLRDEIDFRLGKKDELESRLADTLEYIDMKGVECVSRSKNIRFVRCKMNSGKLEFLRIPKLGLIRIDDLRDVILECCLQVELIKRRIDERKKQIPMIKFQIEKLDLEIGDLREVLRVEVLDQIEREEAVALEELSRACQ